MALGSTNVNGTGLLVAQEEWADHLCAQVVEVDVDFDPTTEFSARIDQRAAGDLNLTRVFSTPQRSSRTRSRVSRSSHNDFFVRLQLAGKAKIEQGGRTALLNPGDLAIYDQGRPYEVSCDQNFGLIVFRIPRIVMEQNIVETDLSTAKSISCSRGIGRLASTYISELYDQIGQIDELNLARVYSTAINLVTGAILEQDGGTADVNEAHVRLRRGTIAYIDRHIADHNLSCGTIADALGVSARSLRQVFESAPYGVSDLIWGRRLEQARRDLADPFKSHISVTGIGYDAGFKDSAHFSRAFKAAFDLTPGAYRADPSLFSGVNRRMGSAATKRPHIVGRGTLPRPS